MRYLGAKKLCIALITAIALLAYFGAAAQYTDLKVSRTFQQPIYLNTAAADAAGAAKRGASIVTYEDGIKYWVRDYNNTTWVQIGINTGAKLNGRVNGGLVTWLHDYVYNVSPCTYYIDGVLYSSPSTEITLAAADATDDRVDLFCATTSNTMVAVTGTPSTPAAAPFYDASTQLQISFATVQAGTTEPTVSNVFIYQENTEWTTATSAGTINPASTNGPYAGSKVIEGTNVANNTYITFTGTAITNLYSALSFAIKSKGNFGTNKKLVLQFYNGSTAVGNPVPLGSASYGFVSTNTTTYQIIAIPLADFGSISTANTLRITQSNTSGTAGWLMDNIQLQNGGAVIDNAYELLANKATTFTTLNHTLYPSTLAVANYVNGQGFLTTAGLTAYELLANKATDFTTLNNTKYPSTQAVANYITGLGYATTSSLSAYELLANKAIDFGVLNNTKYPSTQAVYDFVTGLGYATTSSLSAYELLANKATDFTTLNNTLYPSTQAVANYAEPIITAGTSGQYWAYNKTWQTLNALALSDWPSPIGHAGEFLTTNGTTYSWAVPAGGGGSGVTTMAAIGAVPNANGASIGGSTLTLQPASASFGGVVTTAAQIFAGVKTFNDEIQLRNYGVNNNVSDQIIFLKPASGGDKIAIAGSRITGSNINPMDFINANAGAQTGRFRWYGNAGAFSPGLANTSTWMWLDSTNGLNLNVPFVPNREIKLRGNAVNDNASDQLLFFGSKIGIAGTRSVLGNAGVLDSYGAVSSYPMRFRWYGNNGVLNPSLATASTWMYLDSVNGLVVNYPVKGNNGFYGANYGTNNNAIDQFVLYKNGVDIIGISGARNTSALYTNMDFYGTNAALGMKFRWYNSTYTPSVADASTWMYLNTSGLFLNVAQSIGNATIPASVISQVASTTKGSIPFPKMTAAQRTAIASPAVGLHVYQTDGTEGVYVNKSTGWVFAY